MKRLTTTMRLRPILWLTAAGLLSAIFCSTFMPITVYTAGVWFGAAAAICLKELNIFDNQHALLFGAVSIIAYVLGIAVVVCAFRPLMFNPDSHRGELIAFVAAGVVGGFVLIGGAMWLVRPPLTGVAVIVGAVCGALCGGLLAWLGSALAPSLGMAITKILVPLPWLHGSSPQDREFAAMFVSWQTGMGSLLGAALGRYRCRPSVTQEEASTAIPAWFK